MRKNYRLQMQKALRKSVTHSAPDDVDTDIEAHCPKCSGLLQATEVSVMIDIYSLDIENALYFVKWLCPVCQTSITTPMP